MEESQDRIDGQAARTDAQGGRLDVQGDRLDTVVTTMEELTESATHIRQALSRRTKWVVTLALINLLALVLLGMGGLRINALAEDNRTIVENGERQRRLIINNVGHIDEQNRALEIEKARILASDLTVDPGIRHANQRLLEALLK